MVPRRVLVIAKDDPVRKMLAEILTEEDYGVCATGDLDEASALLTSFVPNLVLIDLTRSLSATSELCRRRRRMNVPLVIISSSRQGPGIGVALGADAFLPFPVMVPELLSTIRRLCDEGVRAPTFLLANGTDRRSPSRPKRGDVRPCPRCGYAMRFEEPDVVAPAWICRNGTCLNAEFVRAESP